MADRQEPTIAAIATPPGPGGIGIIRISGPKSLDILRILFRPRTPSAKLTSHRLYYGWITAPASNQILDEVLAVYMRAPNTYTRDDVVEIHCHSTYVGLKDILAHVCQAGARLADPGEFTKQAFLNGRIDLTRAEAVIDLLNAKTSQGLNLAMNSLQGQLQDEIESLRHCLVSIKAVLEVAIDFPDEDVEILKPLELKSKISDQALPILQTLLAASDTGRILQDGISAVIIGRPNVGKSSLLNALLQEERAIVTAVPGTTRDTIEEHINIKGMPVRIIDTAGIREGADSVEEMGILRSREKLDKADLALLILDSSEELTPEDHELHRIVGNRPMIIVANKQDIKTAKTFNHNFSQTVVPVSAKKGLGIQDLEETIFQEVTGASQGWDPGHSCAPNLRQKASLERVLASCQRFMDGLDNSLTPDLLAIDLQSGLDDLGDIVGHTTTEDVLDMIFADFCIGK